VLPAKDTDPRPKRRIGRYLVTGRIGRGGMGMVYRGRDETLDREVAIKTLTAEGAFDAESRGRFEIEAKAAARLQHPNILTVFELGEDRGMPFIAMELLPGADLESLVRSGEAMPLREKLETVVQVLRGLAYAHERGIVHRDIKPSNIRLLDDGTAKIMDFGIAKLGGTNLTKSGFMVGTVHYMSPEQIRAQELDGRSDVFSVGVILYELLAGRRPFSGEAATDVLYGIAHVEPPPLALAGLGGVGEQLAGIVGRALAKDRDARWPSATAMADALAEVLRGLPGPATTEEAEHLHAARRLLKDGRFEDAEERLTGIIARHPDLLEARRLARTASRERARRRRTGEPEADDFPELDATFQSPATARQPGTIVQEVAPTVAYASPSPEVVAPVAATGLRGRGPWIGAALALLVAALCGLLLVRRPPESRPAPLAGAAPAAAPRAAAPEPAAPPPTTRLRVRVVSDPPGATISVDGKAVPGETPLSLDLDPGRDHVVRAQKGGFEPAEKKLVAGSPDDVRLKLVPAGPLGFVALAAPYPVDVLFRGRALAKAETSARLELPAGRQTLTLVSARSFLRIDVGVDVREGASVPLEAPALGRVSIRAVPDNCEVSIDGFFADYPPILERPVASGTRTVSFKWPDGTRRDEQVEVRPGALAYVMGRKE